MSSEANVETVPTDLEERVAPLDEVRFKSDLTQLIPHMRAFARSLCGDATLADDIAQDALLKSWKNRAKYRDGTNLKAWVFTILRNEFYSLKRRSWRVAPLEQEFAEQTLEAGDDPDMMVYVNEVRLAMTELSDEHREALVLVGASGMSYDEAAEICGVATGTIKSRVSRARVSLEHILANRMAQRDVDQTSALHAMDAILGQATSLVKRKKANTDD